MRRQGFVLIIVLALIGVLAFLALELAQKSGTARSLSLRQIHKSKSNLAARSGLEKGVTAVRLQAYQWTTQFELRTEAAGEDINRNGALDPGEDTNANARLNLHMDVAKDRTPSLALAQDPSAPSPISWTVWVDGESRGASWTDHKTSPSVLSSVHIARSVLDLNAGIESGRGPEGKRYEQDYGLAYAANDPNHPFNIPFVRLLNAWGNVLKHRHMIRESRTFDWGTPIDQGDNLPPPPGPPGTYNLYSPENPGGRFDFFNPSGTPTSEDGLGQLLLASRPTQGYTSLEEPVAKFREYIDSWNAEGMYYPIIDDLIPPPDVEGLVEEFKSLAATDIPRQDVVLMIPGPVNASQMDPINVYFDDEGLRQKWLNCRPYVLRTHLINVNGAATSLLAAIIYGTSYPDAWTYDINLSTHPLTYSRLNYSKYLLENQWCNINFTIAPGLPGSEPRGVVNTADPPIMSMTESRRLASEFLQSRPWPSMQTLGHYIRQWPRGYDGKDISANGTFGMHTGALANTASYNHFYLDFATDNRREKILAHLLNPNVNMASLVYDEALPQPIENLANSLGTSLHQTCETWGAANAAKSVNSYGRRIFCDKSGAGGRMAGWLAIDHGDSLYRAHGTCLDTQNHTQATTALTVPARVFKVLHVHTQKDWIAACKDPISDVSTLGTKWTTYPESPNAPPATWDGHVALRPQTSSLPQAPWGSTLKARILLNAFSAGVHPASELGGKNIWPRGPRVIASTSGRHTNALRNSLKPGPGEPERSVLASGYHAIDSVSDLMPGGGYRVSPFHNSTGVWNQPTLSGSPNDPFRKEAILSIRNSLVTDSVDMDCPNPAENVSPPPGHLITNFTDGAIAFYFKPRFTFPTHAVANYRPNWTLFCMPFVAMDKETGDRCLASPGYAATSDLRKFFAGQIRLSWTPIPSAAYTFNNNPAPFPYVRSFESMNPIVTPSPHYFPFMKGLPMGASGLQYGHQLSDSSRDSGLPGTGTALFTLFPWNTSVASSSNCQLGAWNTAPMESLVLEFSISKYASIDETNGQYSTYSATMGFPGYHWKTWDADDAMSLLGTQCAYLQDSSKPLNLFDTSGDGAPGVYYGEFHTVRKAFQINHPIDVSTTASRGRSLLSHGFHHQPMVAPGRWNHFFIAWKNLWDLMDNSTPSHMGGCLAVYINGFFNKQIQNVHPSDGLLSTFNMAGLFVQSDYSEAYRGNGTPNYWSIWQPLFAHPQYGNTTTYNAFRQKACHIPFPTTASVVAMTEGSYIPMFGEFGTPNIKISDIGYERPPVTMDKIGYLSPYLHKSTPPRLYFGCQPLAPFNQRDREHFLQPFGIPFGTFMDIQVFDGPAATLSDGAAGFNDKLIPGMENYSIFPNEAQFVCYPMNILGEFERQKVAAIRWSCHMPEFHKFWDDQSSLLKGPDREDSQQLVLRVTLNGSEVAVMGKSQDPLYSTYADPDMVEQWLATTPKLIESKSDLKLTLKFSNSESNATLNTTSTPIIEDIDVTLLDNVEYLSVHME